MEQLTDNEIQHSIVSLACSLDTITDIVQYLHKSLLVRDNDLQFFICSIFYGLYNKIKSVPFNVDIDLTAA